MRITRLYTSQTLQVSSNIELEPTAAHHLATVLRIKKGRPVILFNGEGGEYTGEVTDVQRKRVSIRLDTFSEPATDPGLTIEIGACLIKSDRMDWLIQKATELGVSKITPLLSDYTDNKLDADRLQKKARHWQQVMINACEQSGRTRLVEIAPLAGFADWLNICNTEKKYLLHPDERSHSLPPASPTDKTPQSVTIAVGPEGGFSEQEVELAKAKGFDCWSLGARILRAETAPLTALALVHAQWGDFSLSERS